ncbi:MAG: polysaccharide deacetylase family protein [Firmicutes bacterium]|nr:polysaccharide deacetylase family protein [Bacillota bacterium]
MRGPWFFVRIRRDVWIAAASVLLVLIVTLSPIADASRSLQALSTSVVQSELAQIARAYDRAPENARVDPVWKLIPGLSGVHLDIRATLRDARAGQPVRLVFRTQAPTIGLDQFVREPIYRGNPGKRQIGLMFNIAWGEEYVGKILEVLARDRVGATFFVDGAFARAHPGIVLAIAHAGMAIGSHGYGHKLMTRLSRQGMVAQIERANRAIQDATGIRPTLFAPPAGDVNALAVRVAAGLGMWTILWTVDTIDWRKPSAQVIVQRVLRGAAPGVLVLMHPTAATVAALPAIVHALDQRGYQLVTVPQLLSPEPVLPATLEQALRDMPTPRGR